jgi:hypothetical protein
MLIFPFSISLLPPTVRFGPDRVPRRERGPTYCLLQQRKFTNPTDVQSHPLRVLAMDDLVDNPSEPSKKRLRTSHAVCLPTCPNACHLQQLEILTERCSVMFVGPGRLGANCLVTIFLSLFSFSILHLSVFAMRVFSTLSAAVVSCDCRQNLY